MRRTLRLLPAAWFVLLLLLPLGAWTLGARQSNLENRPPTPIPALNRTTMGNAATFNQLDAAIVDRLPLRQHALEARGRIAIELFHDSPNPDVAVGKRSWLYYLPEQWTCTDQGRPATDPADAAEIVARTLVASGRRTGVVAVGSKIVTHTTDLPALDPATLACVRETESRIHSRLRAAPGGLDVQAELEAFERRGQATFLRNDTHWNATGRETFLLAVLNRVRPGMAEDAGLEQGPAAERPGDLGRFVGLDRREDDPVVRAVRTPRDPLPAGDVLLIGDSQMDFSLINSYGTTSVRDVALPGQQFCTWPMVQQGACDDALRRAKVVITEFVARNLRDIVETCWRPVALAGELMRGRTGAWERTDGVRQEGSLLRFDASGQATVRVRSPSADVRDVPRLLRMPIRTLPTASAGAPAATVAMEQRPQAGPAAPCGMPAQGVEGGALFLPVPAGRRASDLVAHLTAPAGTVLGRPEEIVLDGRRVTRR